MGFPNNLKIGSYACAAPEAWQPTNLMAMIIKGRRLELLGSYVS